MCDWHELTTFPEIFAVGIFLGCMCCQDFWTLLITVTWFEDFCTQPPRYEESDSQSVSKPSSYLYVWDEVRGIVTSFMSHTHCNIKHCLSAYQYSEAQNIKSKQTVGTHINLHEKKFHGCFINCKNSEFYVVWKFLGIWYHVYNCPETIQLF